MISSLDNYCFEANEYLNSLADAFSHKLPIPLINAGYQYSSKAVAQAGGLFSNALKMRISRASKDPWSTRTILAMLTPVEKFTRFSAQKNPTSIPGLHFLDRSIISIHQHLYAYLKEVNDLLCVPEDMKAFFSRFSIGTVLDHGSQLGGDLGKVLGRVRKVVSKIIFFILDQVIWITDLFFQTLLSSPELRVLSYLREVIRTGRDKLQGTIKEHAQKVLHEREVRIRSQLVAAVANATNEYIVTLVNRVAFKTFLGLAAYSLLEMACTPTLPATPLRAVVGGATALLIWQNVYKPFLQEYYDSYNSKFNPEECYLQDFLSFHEYNELYLPLEGGKKFFKDASWINKSLF